MPTIHEALVSTLADALSEYSLSGGYVYHRRPPGELERGFTVVYRFQPFVEGEVEDGGHSLIRKPILLDFWHYSNPAPDDDVQLINVANYVCVRVAARITEDHMGHQWPAAPDVHFGPPGDPFEDRGGWYTLARGYLTTVWREVNT